MSVAGVFGPVLFSPMVAHAVVNALNGAPGAISTSAETTWGKAAIATAVIVVSTDFCKYWSHRLHHQTRFLWPFHAVHHSAEVLTPLTLARTHPMETVVRNLIISVLVGVVQGALLFVLVGGVQLLTIGGANALYFALQSPCTLQLMTERRLIEQPQRTAELSATRSFGASDHFSA